MTPYVFMLLIIIFFIYREESVRSQTGKKLCLLFCLFPVFCLIAFKSNLVGTDTMGYMRTYDTLAHFGTFESLDEYGYERVEVGYKYFILLLSKIFPNSQFLLVFVGVAVCVSLYYFIKRTAYNWSFAVFLFVSLGYFQFAMSGIRQTLAMSILLLGYKYVSERKLVKFMLILTAAFMFHKSAIVVLPVYFIANLKVTKKKIGLMLIGIFLLLFIADKLLLSAADVMDYNYGIEETGNGYIFFGIVVLITYLCLSRRKQLTNFKRSNTSMINVNFVSLALWGVRLISRTVERVSLYFMPYTYIILEEYVATSSKNMRKKNMLLVVILFSVLFFKRMAGQEDLCEFSFFFEV